jgi:hypothetical protein
MTKQRQSIDQDGRENDSYGSLQQSQGRASRDAQYDSELPNDTLMDA